MSNLNSKDKIIAVCVAQARSLLEEFGEFYPFAFGVTDDNDELISVSTVLDNDFPDSVDLMNSLKNALQVSHIENNFSGVCICIDTTITSIKGEKNDAIQIMFDSIHFPCMNYFLSYYIKDNVVNFYELSEANKEKEFTF
jgi:hypothetical protein